MIELLQNNLASIKREPVNDKENSGSEASDQSEEDEISPEEQAKIDAEMQKKQAKKKGIRAPVCAEVYGEYNKKKQAIKEEEKKEKEEKFLKEKKKILRQKEYERKKKEEQLALKKQRED